LSLSNHSGLDRHSYVRRHHKDLYSIIPGLVGGLTRPLKAAELHHPRHEYRRHTTFEPNGLFLTSQRPSVHAHLMPKRRPVNATKACIDGGTALQILPLAPIRPVFQKATSNSPRKQPRTPTSGIRVRKQSNWKKLKSLKKRTRGGPKPWPTAWLGRLSWPSGNAGRAA